MIFEKSESRKIKCKVLWWLRVKKRCAFIATEAGGNNSDCLGVNEKRMIEVEVKTSITDFKADFRKNKHHLYSETQNRWNPNMFYFAMPRALIKEALEIMEERGFTKYGVIDSDTMYIEKRAIALHDRPPSSEVKFQLALRMGSELIRFHESLF